MAISPNLFMIICKWTRFSKRQCGWKDKNQDLTIYCWQEIHFSFKNSEIENEVMEKDISSKWKQKEGWSSYSYIRQNIRL